MYDQNGKLDRYGNPLVIGYRREIVPEEAEVVKRIFRMFAEGMSGRAIASQLNAEHVPSPRGRAGAWTHTAIVGSPRKGLGILNNELYIGKMVWNRSKWRKDPENGSNDRRK